MTNLPITVRDLHDDSLCNESALCHDCINYAAADNA